VDYNLEYTNTRKYSRYENSIQIKMTTFVFLLSLNFLVLTKLCQAPINTSLLATDLGFELDSCYRLTAHARAMDRRPAVVTVKVDALGMGMELTCM